MRAFGYVGREGRTEGDGESRNEGSCLEMSSTFGDSVLKDRTHHTTILGFGDPFSGFAAQLLLPCGSMWNFGDGPMSRGLQLKGPVMQGPLACFPRVRLSLVRYARQHDIASKVEDHCA